MAPSLLPPALAVMIAEPRLRAVATPPAVTEATAGSLELHVTPTPGIGFPFASVTVALALLPSDVAVIVADPTATAVASPPLVTVTLLASDVENVTVRPSAIA